MTKIVTSLGTELSEDDIEALADEAERGYDLSKARRVYLGRSAFGRGRGACPRVDVRVGPDLAYALRARARHENRSLSAIVRTALREYLEREA